MKLIKSNQDLAQFKPGDFIVYDTYLQYSDPNRHLKFPVYVYLVLTPIDLQSKTIKVFCIGWIKLALFRMAINGEHKLSMNDCQGNNKPIIFPDEFVFSGNHTIEQDPYDTWLVNL